LFRSLAAGPIWRGTSDDVNTVGRMAHEGLSSDFVDAIERELNQLVTRIQEQRERADRLRRLVEALDEQTVRDEHVLSELRGVLGLAPQMRIEQLSERLRGARLREVAIEVLRASGRGESPIHYREWYDLVRAAGKHVTGKDPVATFLNQINRAPEVDALGGRSGLYVLRTAA
jgi:hypothetical protein